MLPAPSAKAHVLTPFISPETFSGKLDSVVHSRAKSPIVSAPRVNLLPNCWPLSPVFLRVEKYQVSTMMRSGVALTTLILVGFVCGQDVQPDAQIFCDDPSVEAAVTSALHTFNDRLTASYKLALYEILTATKSENGSDSLYSLQFSSRTSDCLAGSPKPYTECNYHPFGRQEPLPCNATVLVTETEKHTKQVHCLLDDHIVPERAPCLGCPMEIDENSEDIKVPLSVSISKFNSVSNSTHLFSLHSVRHATRQVVAGFRFKLEFDVRRTTCAKAEHSELSDLCVHDDEMMEVFNCRSTVDVAPWRHVAPQANIECQEGPLPPRFMSRRLPPGWTPFRDAIEQAPTGHADKKESSEEDATDASSTAATAKGPNDDPFHCPSKPWKTFLPIRPLAPNLNGTSPDPTIRPLRDEDLLG
ncbi:kininogen-1 isoform X2 [Syngnathus scovelli]|uniref:kininogen-1 isoform X2 n=1 Tax=Syngnathus scovelli TaxID=161590 RepID=UPI00211012F8|nr:kininogen-1 isoform X2 [Syngnathus scovelli]